MKHQRCYQLLLLGGRNDAGVFPSFVRDGRINPLAPKCASVFTIQTVIHAALGKVEDGLTGQCFQFAANEPPSHLVALAIFDESFLA